MTTLDYGQDTYCLDSLQPGRFARDIPLLAQNCVHRLTTPRGALRGGPDEQNYGMDLPGRIGSATSSNDAAALPGQIATELKKDKRVLDVVADVTEVVDGPSTSWVIIIEVRCALGVFRLEASEVTVEFVGLGGSA